MKIARNRKAILVEEAPPGEREAEQKGKLKPVSLTLKEQKVLQPGFNEGDKVRYMTVYGNAKSPQQWESKPYRIISRSLQYEWLNDMNYAYLYRLRHWDASVERQGWTAWDTSTAWESQLESWVEIPAASLEPSPLCAEEQEMLD